MSDVNGIQYGELTENSFTGQDYPKEICFCEHCFKWHAKWEDCKN